MLYFYGLASGIQSLFYRRFTRETIKNIIVPVNYWRIIEFDLVFNEMHPTDEDTILDIGSPKLLSLFLADKSDSRVVSTDINNYFINEYVYLREMRKISKENFLPLVMDGRELRFPDQSFTKVFSISVFEHIPDEGDTACIREISRVLKKGGDCLLTVPFSPKGSNEYKKAGDFYWSDSSNVEEKNSDKVFFQRRYDEVALYERIIKPSGLQLKKLQFVGEKVFKNSSREVSRYLTPITGPIQPVLAHALLTKPVNSWKELDKPLAAFIVLHKG